MPEVRFRRHELDADILLAVARAVDRDYAALHRLRRVIIHQDQGLSNQHNFFEWKQSAVSVHRLRIRLRTKLFARICFPAHCQGNRQGYPKRPSSFFATKMK